MIMMALLLMVGSFYLGTLFGNRAPPIYVTSSSNSSSSSSPSPGTFFLTPNNHKSLYLKIKIRSLFYGIMQSLVWSSGC
uniref:Uncharacterized protein MANES_08G056400 n=1 Tax=Rhizophora mucronata TaxID=61149 RepID=A0A2P2JNP0_RHIMU